MNIENFGMREKMYFHHVIGIRRETTAQQMRALLDAIRTLLAGRYQARIVHHRRAPDPLRAFLAGYRNRGLHHDPDGTKFLQTQEDLLLRIMDTIEANGTAAAFPTQTLYLERERTPPS